MTKQVVYAAILALLAAGVAESQPIALGPYVQFTAPGRAIVRWRTDEPVPSVIEYELTGTKQRREEPTPKNDHAIELTGLRLNTLYHYRIVLPGDAEMPEYECDTTFNYTVPPVPDGPSPYPEDELTRRYEAAAEHIIAQTGVTRGHCVVLGCGVGRLAYELAKRSHLYVTGVDTEDDAVAQARRRLKQAGVYGSRVTVRRVASLSDLPFTGCFANLIVSDRMLTQGTCVGTPAETFRVLRPNGGVAFLGQPAVADKTLDKAELTTWLEAGGQEFTITDNDKGVWARMTRPSVQGAGEWSHQYGSADNSARSHDTLLGATRTDQLHVQWLGRPGPRAMVDRNPRKPAPLYVNGRLFTQGLHRIIAQDAYNGAIYWSLEIPALQRFNMPRDCSNWCADDAFVYAAVNNACWRLDAGTGTLDKVYQVIQPAGADAYDWGYVAQAGDTLFGSALREDTVYTNFWGKGMAGWYDAPIGPVTYKVCSDALFALSKTSGETVWTYGDAVIINPTITIGGGRLCFVECRNPDVKAAKARRVGQKELWEDQYLVALDPETGETLWETPIDTVDGTVVFYMIYANETLILAASKTQYHLYGFDARTGQATWEASHKWTGNNHSGHMQHPAVVGNVVYLEPCGYDLATGERVTDAVGRHEGCATYLATEGALIYRGAGRRTSMWDPASAEATSWERLRPGCWLSTIAGGGMVLSPEGGGGCSCGGWMETSLAFMRKDE